MKEEIQNKKIPVLVKIIAALRLIAGGVIVIASIFVAYFLLTQKGLGLIQGYAGIIAGVLFVAGLIIIFLALGIWKLRSWALWILSVFVGLQLVSLILSNIYLNSLVPNVGQNVTQILMLIFSIIIVTYLWLSHYFVYKSLSESLNSLRKVLGVLIVVYYIVVFISIIVILAAIMLSSVSSAQLKSRDATRKSDLRTLAYAVELYYEDYGKYPAVVNMEELDQILLKNNYIKSNIEDPLYLKQKYRYGVSKDGQYYRLDAQLEVQTDTSAQKDGGADPNRYEVGPGLGDNVGTVTCMDNCAFDKSISGVQSSKDSAMTSIDQYWNLYTNHKLGFSLEIPKINMINGTTGPVETIESGNIVYITSNNLLHYKDVKALAVSDKSEIEKTTGTPWAILIRGGIKNDDDINSFIKSRYGDACSMKSKNNISGDKELYRVYIETTDPSGGCWLNYITDMLFDGDMGKIANWDIGQSPSFGLLIDGKEYDVPGMGVDGRMINTFQFLK